MVSVTSRIVDRLVACKLPFAILVAPAGFGKTKIARAYAAQFARSATVTATATATASDVLHELEAAAGGDLGRFGSPEAGACLIVENAERFEDEALEELLAALRD